MVDVWRVVGCFGQAMVREVPCVPVAAVKPSEEGEIIYQVSLHGHVEQKMTLNEFRSCLQEGDAFRADLGIWPPDHVLYIEVGSVLPIWLKVKEAEKRLWNFVRDHRRQGELFLPLDRKTALKHFDLARRVSNEPLDALRVSYLLEGPDRELWIEWLEKYYPELDHRSEAIKLGLIVG